MRECHTPKKHTRLYKMDISSIVTARNALLAKIHGRIPSYALWDEASIADDTTLQHLQWFVDTCMHMERKDKLANCSNETSGAFRRGVPYRHPPGFGGNDPVFQ